MSGPLEGGNKRVVYRLSRLLLRAVNLSYVTSFFAAVLLKLRSNSIKLQPNMPEVVVQQKSRRDSHKVESQLFPF